MSTYKKVGLSIIGATGIAFCACGLNFLKNYYSEKQ
jgi:hypothetical protein